MNKDSNYKIFFALFIRSFFIQAVWNFKSLLSIGWTFSLLPIANKIFTDKELYQNFLNRHLSFFNAHPYVASYALGAIARLEEEAAKSDGKNYQQIEKFKNAIIGPLGAIGDQLFWAIIKPASIIVGFFGILVMPEIYQKLIFLIIFLILYNIPHIYIRYFDLPSLNNKLRIMRIENFSKLKTVYSIIGGLIFSIVIGYLVHQSVQRDLVEIPMFWMSFGIAYFLRSRRRMTYLPVFIPLLIAMVIGILI